jgi:TRAP-type transport system periplasmic protein
MKRFLFMIPALAMLGLGGHAEAATATLKVTTCLQRSHNFTQAFLKTYLEPLDAEHGAVKLDYLGGPEVTPYQEQGSALKRGLVDMILCPAAYYGGLFGAARLPGAQNVSIAEIKKNGAWQMMETAWEKNLNAHIVAWVFSKGQIFYTYMVKKPTPSDKTGLDLKGLKIRSTGLYNPFLKAMGATVVVMAPGDVYAGLQRGVVDGLCWPWGSISQYGWQRFIKYRVTPSFFGASQLLLVNLDKWKSLDKAQQEMLDRQAEIFATKGSDYVVKTNKEDDAKLEAAGVKDIELKGAARAAYLDTIYGAKWKQNDGLHYSVDYQKLKPLLYKPGQPGS